MRLLFVHDRIGSLGGAEVNLLATAGALRRRGHAVGLAHGAGTGQSEEPWREAFTERFPLAAGAGTAGLAEARIRFRPEAMYVHNHSEPGLLRALGDGPQPVVRMVHDHAMYCMRGYKYHTLSRRICLRAASVHCVCPCGASVARGPGGGWSLRWVSYRAKRREIALNRRFHRLIVASGYMRDELLRNGFAANRIELHPPVPCGAGTTPEPSFGSRNLIVYAGQIVRGKGVDVLLEALARVTQPFECLILGEGRQRARCERLSRRLGLQERVHFTGFVPQARIAEAYREASLAVMSSVWPEPFGAAGLEAMRAGLPVVAFDAGAIREWLLDGVNGLLAPWMDRAGLAERVDALLRDKVLARRLGGQGRQLAGERFNFDNYIEGLEGVFNRAIAQGPTS